MNPICGALPFCLLCANWHHCMALEVNHCLRGFFFPLRNKFTFFPFVQFFMSLGHQSLLGGTIISTQPARKLKKTQKGEEKVVGKHNKLLPTMSTCGNNILLRSLTEVILWSMGTPKVQQSQFFFHFMPLIHSSFGRHQISFLLLWTNLCVGISNLKYRTVCYTFT